MVAGVVMLASHGTDQLFGRLSNELGFLIYKQLVALQVFMHSSWWEKHANSLKIIFKSVFNW